MNTKTEAKTKSANSSITFVLLLLTVSGAILYFSYVAFTMLLIGFIPTFVAFFVDKTNENYLTITVFGGNLLGCAVPLIKVFSMQPSMYFLQTILTDIYNWFWIYSGAAFGWLLFFIIPPFVERMIAMVDKVQLELIKSEQKKLIEEWGNEVRQR